MSEESNKPNLDISVNTEYRNYEVEFIEAYATKRIINSLLVDRCKFNKEQITQATTLFLDFPTRLIVCEMRANGKWSVGKMIAV